MDDPLTVILGLSAGLGLAAASGFRVFLPLLVAGLGVRFELLPVQEGFAWIGGWPALIGLGTATVLEIGAYYVPWVDNALDSVASPAAVLAGIVASAALFVGLDPFVQWSCAIIVGGGVAGTVQGASVATRALSTGTTGGFANFLVSTLENLGALLLAALSVIVPALAGALVLLLVVLAARRILRWREARAAGRAATG